MTDSQQLTDTPAMAEQLIIDAGHLSGVVAAGGDWTADSPCEGWTAADVVDHLIETQRDFFGQHGADLGDEPDGSAADRWAEHWSRLEPRLTPELMVTEFSGALGTTTVGAALSTFYGLDLLVHRWDLGQALGQQVDFTDDELSRIETILDQLGDNLYTYGASKPPLPVPTGASRQVAVLARLGRRA